MVNESHDLKQPSTPAQGIIPELFPQLEHSNKEHNRYSALV